jgi:cytochrome c-type biogenesis protein CcmH
MKAAPFGARGGARVGALLGAILCIAAAGDPADRLADPAREARARGLFQETRCLVCQGESIDDSEAPLAHDLRGLIRTQVGAGRSDAEVRAFLRARYGDFVLLRPPFSPANALLWGGPFLVAAAGAVLLIRRRSKAAPPPPLTPQEEARLKALGGDGIG